MALISATPRTVSKTSAKGLFRLNDIAEHQAAGNFPSDKTLDLNFVNNATIGSNAAPDDAIDFSRASQATFTDSDGLVKYAPHNLGLYSEDLSNVNWVVTAVTKSSNTDTSPDGTTTADKITEDTANSGHRIRQGGLAVVSGKHYSLSVYLKISSGTRNVDLRFLANNSAFSFSRATFDLVNGTAENNTSFPVDNLKIENVGNDWYRCSVVKQATATANATIEIGLNDGTTASYTGDGSSSVLVWGAQFSQHKFVPIGNPYIKTTTAAVYGARLDHEAGYFLSANQAQNLILDSETIANASSGWTTTVSTANSTDVPSGIGADNSTEITYSANAQVYNLVNNIVAGETYTFSYYVKLGAKSNNRYAVYDDTANAFIVSSAINTSASASEWTRFSLTVTAPANCEQLRFYVDRADNASEYGTIFITGVQVEVGSTATSYNQTNGIEYYGGGATQNGLLIEEQRVNIFEYSEEFDNAAWTLSNATISANQVIAPNGTLTADELIYSNGSSTGRIVESFNSASQNTDYTLSCFIKNNGLNTSSLRFYSAETSFIQTEFDLRDGAITSTTAGASSSIEDYGNGWFRVTLTFNTGLAATSKQTQICRNAFQGDGTLSFYVWGAQLEEGAFATSYIPTSGSTVTRSADLATMSTGSLPFTGYNQSEGTIETKFEFVGYLSVFGSVYKFQNSDHTERIGVLQLNSSNSIYEEIRDSVAGNTIQFSSLNSNVGEIITHLLAYKADDVAVRRAKDISGTVTLTGHEDSSVTIPDTIDRLGFGVRTDTSSVVSSVIFKYFRYYPRRLSNDTLFAIRRG